LYQGQKSNGMYGKKSKTHGKNNRLRRIERQIFSKKSRKGKISKKSKTHGKNNGLRRIERQIFSKKK
jgi:hypothetical protein